MYNSQTDLILCLFFRTSIFLIIKNKNKQNNGYNDRHIQLGIFKLKWTDVKIQFTINNICGI